jgi:hypothetical protein
MLLLDHAPNSRIFESYLLFENFLDRMSIGNVGPNLDAIKKLNDSYDFVLINCSTEHWGSEKEFGVVATLHDLFSKYFDKDFLILTHDPCDELLSSNLVYFPFWWWRCRKMFRTDPNSIGMVHRKYLVSNLNWGVKDFRIANYLMMMQAPAQSQFLITMHNTDINLAYNGYFDLTAEETATWENIKSTLPTSRQDPMPPNDRLWVTNIQHPAFFDSYLHLVSEASVHDKIFLTEKTWKPIASGQLFLIWGNAGIVDHLRRLGFDVFDDIIDHSYDSEPDHRSRLRMIHREIHRLVQVDFAEIYAKTLDRRQGNLQKFIDDELIHPWVTRINNILSQYGQQIDITTRDKNARID